MLLPTSASETLVLYRRRAFKGASACAMVRRAFDKAVARNGPQHFDMLPTEPVAISFEESSSRVADEIGHLQRWPAHLLFQLQ